VLLDGVLINYNKKLKYKEESTSENSNLHPISIRRIEKIFSLSVFGATFPNPTEIRPVKQKYREVQYRL
jgi:hypothetical protein